MNTPDVMRKARRHRIELIALGMALAGGPDREVILSNVFMADLQSELVHECMDAIREQDGNQLRKVLRTWGVQDVDIKNIAGTLVNEIRRRGDDDRARSAVERLSQRIEGCSVSEIKDSLEKTLAELSGS